MYLLKKKIPKQNDIAISTVLFIFIKLYTSDTSRIWSMHHSCTSKNMQQGTLLTKHFFYLSLCTKLY